METQHAILIRGREQWVPKGKPVTLHLPEYNILITDTVLGEGVSLWSNVNIYGAEIGPETKIGAFVEIRKGVRIGRRVKIEPFVFIPEGVTLEDCVFVGPNVIFTNDPYPRACDPEGNLIQEYEIVETLVKQGASIGAGAVIRCGITVGESALIGAGAVVVEDVPPRGIVYGPKATLRRFLSEEKEREQ